MYVVVITDTVGIFVNCDERYGHSQCRDQYGRNQSCGNNNNNDNNNADNNNDNNSVVIWP